MPRTRRWEFLGEIHHVMARGLEGRDIFIGDADRAKFLALLEKNLLRYGVSCLGFALMSNHYHLLLRPRERKLGECLRSLICWCAYRDLGMSMVCIGEFFGITNGAVSRLVWRGEELAKAGNLTFDVQD